MLRDRSILPCLPSVDWFLGAADAPKIDVEPVSSVRPSPVGRSAIPIITLLHEFMSSGKGQYRRLIGKHTHSFCSRAVKRSTCEIQKKILFIASAGADDFIARKLGIQFDKKAFFTARKSALGKGVNPNSSASALRVYLSALMVLLSNDKEMLLAKAGVDEAGWMNIWCFVFEYAFADQEVFNSELIASYQREGVVGLVRSSLRLINESLSLKPAEIDNEFELLRDALIHDVAVIHGVIK